MTNDFLGRFSLIAFATIVCAEQPADDVIGIRCVNYEIALHYGAYCGFYSPQDVVLDIYIHRSRGIGWWQGATMRIDRERPAKLEMTLTEYRLDATLATNNDRWNEWLILDRGAGTISHYAQRQGSQTTQLKRGGRCGKIEPKF